MTPGTPDQEKVGDLKFRFRFAGQDKYEDV